MKKILTLALALVMIFALACPSALAKDGSVYWLNFKPELDETAQQLAKMYTEKTGVERWTSPPHRPSSSSATRPA